MKPILGHGGLRRGREGPPRPLGARRPAPHPPREERGGLGEPPLPLLEGLHRGLLLRPAHRQAAPAASTRRASSASPPASPARCRASRRQGDMDGARRVAREYRDIFEPGSFFLEVQSNGMQEQLEVNAKLAAARARRGHPARRHRRRALREARGREGARGPHVHRVQQDLPGPEAPRATTPTASSSPSPDDMVAALPDFREAIDNTAAHRRDVQRRARAREDLPPALPAAGGHERGRVHRRSSRGRGSTGASARSTASTRTTATPTATGSRWSSASSRRWGSPATSSSSRTSSTGRRSTRSRSAPAAARARAPSSPGRSASPTSTRSAGTCSSSGSSTPSASRCRTSTSTSARTGATRSSSYVRGKYGKDNVGQIITFGSLKARSVIRDVVRVMGLPFAEGDRIAKLVPDPVQGKTPPLKELVFGTEKMPAEPRLEELYQKPAGRSRSGSTTRGASSRSRRRTSSTSRCALEGLNRQAGLHAAGVVIADKPLWEYVPAYKDDKSEHARVAVREGRGRGGGPREVRLPRPEDPHRHRRRAPAREAEPPGDEGLHRRPTSPSTTPPSTSSSAAATPPASSRWSPRASPRW